MSKLRSLSITSKLFLLALALRLVPVLFSIHLPIGLDDMFQYDMLARSLISGNGYRWYAQPDLELVEGYVKDYVKDYDGVTFFAQDYDPRGILTSFRAPGYPVFLALIYAISGMQWRFFAARLANAVLGASLAPMTYLLARRLFPRKENVARFAGITLVIYPMLVVYPLGLITENLFFPLVLGGLLALLKASKSGSDRHFLFAGALLGAATLTRSVIFAFVGFAVLWIWFSLRKRRGALVFTAAVTALVLPWTIRNSLLEGKFTFVENSLGYNLHMGYHPKGTGSFQFGISLELVPYLDDGVRNELGIQAGLRFIRENPGRVPYLMVRKLGYFFGLERRALTYFYSNNFFGPIPTIPLVALFLLFMLPFPIVSSLAALALPFVRRTKPYLLILLFLVTYLLPHILLLAEDRFHMVTIPVLAVLAGYAWYGRKEIWTAAKANRLKLAAVIILLGLLWLNWGLELWRDADKLAILFGPNGNLAGFGY